MKVSAAVVWLPQASGSPVAQARFSERMALLAEQGTLRDAEQTRSLVEQAKARLMREHGMTEPEAFKHIHYTSRRERRTMRQVAEEILAADAAPTAP